MDRYLFEVGQECRILKTLETDTHLIEDLLGRKAKIVRRSRGGFGNENWYDVAIDGRKEPFREEELDKRFAKKPGPQGIQGRGGTGEHGRSGPRRLQNQHEINRN